MAPSDPSAPGPLFPPHGRVAFSRQGNRLWGEAEGPFNIELARDVRQRAVAWCRHLKTDGAFDHVCEFRGSVLASPDALRELGLMLRDMAVEAIGPVRTAYVFPPDLEGGSILAPIFVRGFAATHHTLRIVANREEAQAWLDANPV